MELKKHIPNALTLGNLACGVLGIIFLMGFEQDGLQNRMIIFQLFVAALVFDFLDGLAARLLKVSSPIGKDLDSLADVVSFGVLPGLMMYKAIGWSFQTPDDAEFGIQNQYFAYLGLMIPLFSALRLAKFNHDTRQSSGFRGLPTPANAIFFFSIFLIVLKSRRHSVWEGPIVQFFSHPAVLLVLCIVFSLLLVSEIKLLAFKFKSFGLKENWTRYLFFALSFYLYALLTYQGVPLIILSYFLISFVHYRWVEKSERV